MIRFMSQDMECILVAYSSFQKPIFIGVIQLILLVNLVKTPLKMVRY